MRKTLGPRTGQLDTEALRMQSLLFIEPDLQTLTPNILKAYQASEDFKPGRSRCARV